MKGQVLEEWVFRSCGPKGYQQKRDQRPNCQIRGGQKVYTLPGAVENFSNCSQDSCTLLLPVCLSGACSHSVLLFPSAQRMKVPAVMFRDCLGSLPALIFTHYACLNLRLWCDFFYSFPSPVRGVLSVSYLNGVSEHIEYKKSK